MPEIGDRAKYHLGADARSGMVACDVAWNGEDRMQAISYDDAPVEALPLAEHSLQAHLARLGIEPAE